MQRSFAFFLVALGSWAFEKGFTEENFVRIWPENPVVQYGASLQINCSANTEADAIGLETPFSKETIGIGSNWKTFRITNITAWNTHSLCYAEDHPGSAKATITVYKSPSRIELDPVPEMEVGKHYDLTCRIFGVAPIRDLTVTFLKGEEQLLVKTFKDRTQHEADDVVVKYQIRAHQNDYNKTITCQTSLDLRPRGPLLKNTSHGISLWTYGPQSIGHIIGYIVAGVALIALVAGIAYWISYKQKTGIYYCDIEGSNGNDHKLLKI